MAILFNGEKKDFIAFNGVLIEKVVFNNVVVFEKKYYTKPTGFIDDTTIHFKNTTKDPLILKVTGQQGVSFNVNDTDETVTHTTTVRLPANGANNQNWYWIGSIAQPTTVDFKIEVYKLETLGETLLDTFWITYGVKTIDDLLGTWVFNDKINFTDWQFGFDMDFTCLEEKYISLIVPEIDTIEYQATKQAYTLAYEFNWLDENYKTIDITNVSRVTNAQKLIDFMKENATKYF